MSEQSSKEATAPPKKLQRIRRHPFIVPVVTLLMLVVASLVGIVFFGATTLGPADSRDVTLFVDEEMRTLPTRAKTVGDLLEKLSITIDDGDVVEPSVDTPIYEDGFNVNVYRARDVVIRDGKRSVSVKTASRSPRIIARNNGIVVFPEDDIIPEASTDIASGDFLAERYVIDRSTQVTLILYGQLISVRTQSETVEELLKEKEIAIEEGDSLVPSPETKLKSSTKVTITRPGQKIATR